MPERKKRYLLELMLMFLLLKRKPEKLILMIFTLKSIINNYQTQDLKL